MRPITETSMPVELLFMESFTDDPFTPTRTPTTTPTPPSASTMGYFIPKILTNSLHCRMSRLTMRPREKRQAGRQAYISDNGIRYRYAC